MNHTGLLRRLYQGRNKKKVLIIKNTKFKKILDTDV